MSEEPKKRKLTISEQEIVVLKEIFAENDFLLKALRKYFLNFPTSKPERDAISIAFRNPMAKVALQKKMFPSIDAEAEIGETADYWFGTDGEILGKDPDTIKQVVESKYRAITWLRKVFDTLEDPVENVTDFSVDFKPDFKSDKLQINLLTRNRYVKGVETGLTMTKVVAGLKNETPDQAKKRIEADSNK